MKRDDHLSWDEYFMGIASLSALRSKDPSTQVGACIVNEEKRILSMGYNGMPHHCHDDEYPWERGEGLDSKYLYVCHAELNAILNSSMNGVNGATLYVTLFPCNECAKAIIQCGIKKVVYLENKYADTESVKASVMMLEKCGVAVEEYKKSGREITLSL